MDPWLASALLLIALLLLVMAGLSALETALLSARRSRLAQHGPERRINAAEALIEDPDPFLTSAHLAKSICEAFVYPAGAIIAVELTFRWFVPVGPSEPGPLLRSAWPVILVGSLLLYLLVTVAGESLPKAFASRAPERMLLRYARLIRLFTLGFSPVLWVTRKLARLLAQGAGVDTPQAARAAHTEEEIKLLVEGSAQEGVLEEEEKELIHSIFEFTDTVVRQIMVPRIDIVSVPATATVHEAIREAVASGHSRLPVHDGTLDTVVGIVLVKDLIPYLLDGTRERLVRDVVRTPFFIPPGKKIDELLQEFRTHKNQLAIVVDEFGGTAGLVTIEDVLEEIVGEIEDEYDVPEEPSMVDFPGEGTVLDARMTIDDCNAELDLDLRDEENDTIGGFVFSLFGRPPRAGERVQHGSLEFVVEAVDGIRLQRIRVLRREPEEPAAGEDTA